MSFLVGGRDEINQAKLRIRHVGFGVHPGAAYGDTSTLAWLGATWAPAGMLGQSASLPVDGLIELSTVRRPRTMATTGEVFREADAS